MMIFMNSVTKGKCPMEYAEGFVKLISCICPHLGEELWEMFGHTGTIAYETWPTYDEAALVVDTVKIGVQVNGKVRGTIEIGAEAEEEEAMKEAFEIASVNKAIDGKPIRKVIYVKGKILNIVAK